MSRPSSTVPPALARHVMRVHLGYLLLLPLFAWVAMGYSPDMVQAVFFGWLPYVCYALAVGSAYALSTHPVRMAAVVLLVPVELAVENLLFHHSLRFFLMEAAFIEVTALVAGMFLAMVVYRPSGCVGAVFGAVLLGCSLFAFGRPVLAGYRELPLPALPMLGIALLTATWNYSQLVMPSARSWVRGGGARRPQMRFDGGWIGRVLAPGPDEVLIGPGAPKPEGPATAEPDRSRSPAP